MAMALTVEEHTGRALWPTDSISYSAFRLGARDLYVNHEACVQIYPMTVDSKSISFDNIIIYEFLACELELLHVANHGPES